jgi:hypothetical protein
MGFRCIFIPGTYDRAPDEIPDIEHIRKLLKDIRECRQRKTRDLLGKVDGSRLEVIVPAPPRRTPLFITTD